MNSQTVKKSSFWSNLFKTTQQKDSLVKILQTSPIFSELSEKELDFIIKTVNQRIYQAGEYIFLKGDPGLALFFVLDGQVDIILNDGNNKYKLAELFVGDFFGEIALLGEDSRTASALAAKESKLAVLFKNDLDEFINKYPDRGVKILKGISSVLATRLKNMNEDFFNLYFSKIKREDKENGNDKKNFSAD